MDEWMGGGAEEWMMPPPLSTRALPCFTMVEPVLK